MPRPKRMVGPPKYYNPAEIADMPQWAGAPLSHSPTPPRRPVVYMTGDHVVPAVGLGTTVVAPPASAVAAGTQPPIPPTILGIVGLPMAAVALPIPEVAPPIPQADVYLIDVSGSSVVAAGGSAVEPTTTAVIPSGMVRTTIAAFEAVAAGSSAVVAGSSAVDTTDSLTLLAHLYDTDEDE